MKPRQSGPRRQQKAVSSRGGGAPRDPSPVSPPYQRRLSLRRQSRAPKKREIGARRRRRVLVYGYQVGSRLPPKRVITRDSERQYFLIPGSPWRKPIPDCFHP